MLKRLVAPLLLAGFLVALGPAAQAKALDNKTLETWLQKYGAAWAARDAAAAGTLFTADATYHEVPFDPVKQGRAAIQDYWKTVTADQSDIKFDSKVIAIKDNTGVAHWKATFKVQSTGATIALDGVFVLEFDEKGLCKSLREWWHVKAG